MCIENLWARVIVEGWKDGYLWEKSCGREGAMVKATNVQVAVHVTQGGQTFSGGATTKLTSKGLQHGRVSPQRPVGFIGTINIYESSTT